MKIWTSEGISVSDISDTFVFSCILLLVKLLDVPIVTKKCDAVNKLSTYHILVNIFHFNYTLIKHVDNNICKKCSSNYGIN